MTNLDFQNGYMVGIAASGTTKSSGVQADWNQNDDTSPSYIKNRPFYSELQTVNYREIIETQTDIESAIDDAYINYSNGPIGLIDGEAYSVTITDPATSEIIIQATVTATNAKNNPDLSEFFSFDCISLFDNDNNVYLFDGAKVSVNAEGYPEFTQESNSFIVYNYDTPGIIIKVEGKGISSTIETIYKVPDKYLPEIPKVIIDQEYNAESENAQSGIAIKQAINKYDESLMIGTEKIKDHSITGNKLEMAKLLQHTTLKDDVSSINLSVPAGQKYSKIVLALRAQVENPTSVKFIRVMVSGGSATETYIPITLHEYDSTSINLSNTCISIIAERVASSVLKTSVDYHHYEYKYGSGIIDAMHTEYTFFGGATGTTSISFSFHNDKSTVPSTTSVKILKNSYVELLGITSA